MIFGPSQMTISRTKNNVGRGEFGVGVGEMIIQFETCYKFDIPARPHVEKSNTYLDIQTRRSTERSKLELPILESLVYSWHLSYETG